MCALSLLLSACASQPPQPVLPASDSVASLLGRAEYRVGPSDLLAVSVFQVKDLDREVRVNNAGQISLPLIGTVDAAGRTIGELEGEIASRYGARYLQNPQISVFVKELVSQRITVGGAVGKPGIFPVNSRVTLVQAIALAQGFTDVASHRNVFVFRTVDGQRQFARFDVAAIEAGEQTDPELQGEDVVMVDSSAGKQSLKTLVQLTPFLTVWRVYQ
ncbi:polysaccharide export outer membrane protein [Lysobacter niastensis]|uniref:Polysaccharide export outer membrane protein n=1 Tax=Lysobacter niastensis TaxID=380629 RepID=A0ABU1WEP7_9GAMM|nr:polysaccharide export outer membrane protein [Lysobacter niastensis]